MSKKSTPSVPPRGVATTASPAVPLPAATEPSVVVPTVLVPLPPGWEIASHVSSAGADEVLLPPIPCCPPPSSGYVPQHVDVRLTDRQGRALRRTVEGLDRRGATIDNANNRRGRVVSAADAVKWILDRLADAHEQFDAAAPVAPSADPGVSLPDDMLGTR